MLCFCQCVVEEYEIKYIQRLRRWWSAWKLPHEKREYLGMSQKLRTYNTDDLLI